MLQIIVAGERGNLWINNNPEITEMMEPVDKDAKATTMIMYEYL